VADVAPSEPMTVKEARLQNKVIDVNQATLEDLQLLPGIGPKMAQRILDRRQAVRERRGSAPSTASDRRRWRNCGRTSSSAARRSRCRRGMTSARNVEARPRRTQAASKTEDAGSVHDEG
jgi:hypothetical protein